jgi:hypothetical protein
MSCGPYDYQCWKRVCNTNSPYSQDCVNFFLTLPKGDTGLTKTRQDFAGEHCRSIGNLFDVPCRMLCRDSPVQCRDQRRSLCRDVSLTEAIEGRLPTTSPLYPFSLANSSFLTLCSCYLDQSQYKSYLIDLGNRLGQSVRDEVEKAINYPQCYFSLCSRSDVGKDTQYEPCQSLAACVQSISVDTATAATAVTANVCMIGNVTNTSYPPSINLPWGWILSIMILLLVGVIVVLSLVKRRVIYDIVPVIQIKRVT